jgi:hypothetical protein
MSWGLACRIIDFSTKLNTMQERRLTELLSDAFNKPFDELGSVTPKMEKLSVLNRMGLQDKDVPDYLRIPTAGELIEIRQWAVDYKKANKHASKREIRKATQSHFKIKVYR